MYPLGKALAISSGQAPSCHSEPKGWGPLRLCLFIICICTSVDSDSHHSSCRSHYKALAIRYTLRPSELHVHWRQVPQPQLHVNFKQISFTPL
jgi:hypothetical protein